MKEIEAPAVDTEIDPNVTLVPSLDPEADIDRELQAAIEYKIAVSGVGGAELVLDLLNDALRRRNR